MSFTISNRNVFYAREREITDHALIFLHIPKAAGTTLQTIIERQRPHTATMRLSGDGAISIQEFLKLPDEKRRGIKLLEGHMPYGMHRYLGGPALYITMLRDPVSRLISHYHHARTATNHYLHREVISKNMSLSDYARSAISSELDNDQTRMISGIEDLNTRLLDGEERRTLRPYSAPVTEETLQIAKENLRNHFAVVGIVEQFDESLLVMKKYLGWEDVHYQRRNVTRTDIQRVPITREERDIIAKRNHIDIELYEHVTRNFERLIGEQGETFQRELSHFKRNNTLRSWQGHLQTLQSKLTGRPRAVI